MKYLLRMPKSGICANGTCGNPGKHLCSGCGEELYCTKDCQKAHWPAHKLACKMAVKPEAAAFLKSFDALSIKQLKNLLTAKAATMDPKPKYTLLGKLERVAEKPELVKLANENVSTNEVEFLLAGTSKPAPALAASSSGVKANQRNVRNGKYVMQEAPPGTVPTPEQMRQQAAMMRKDPGLYL